MKQLGTSLGLLILIVSEKALTTLRTLQVQVLIKHKFLHLPLQLQQEVQFLNQKVCGPDMAACFI